MRINRPKPFDPGKEYVPGERFTKDDYVCKVSQWTDGMTKVAKDLPVMFRHKCNLCIMKHTDCNSDSLCWPWNRKDRKNMFYTRKSKINQNESRNQTI